MEFETEAAGGRIFFTSDNHFFHGNILQYCNRPFHNLEKMAETLIENYIKTVNKNDLCIWLGDITIKRDSLNKEKIKNIITYLPGKKILIKGNHDYYSDEFYKECGFINILDKIISKDFVIIHDPKRMGQFRSNEKKYYLHGHMHYNSPSPYRDKFDMWMNNKNVYDVGVDANHFAPVSLSQIKKFFKEREKGFKI